MTKTRKPDATSPVQASHDTNWTSFAREPLSDPDFLTERPIVIERRQMIQEGLDDVTAGRLLSMAAMERWADSLRTDHEIPLPKVGE